MTLRKRWLIAIAVYAVLFWATPWLTGPEDAWSRILIAHALLVAVGIIGACVGMIVAPWIRGNK